MATGSEHITQMIKLKAITTFFPSIARFDRLWVHPIMANISQFRYGRLINLRYLDVIHNQRASDCFPNPYDPGHPKRP